MGNSCRQPCPGTWPALFIGSVSRWYVPVFSIFSPTVSVLSVLPEVYMGGPATWMRGGVSRLNVLGLQRVILLVSSLVPMVSVLSVLLGVSVVLIVDCWLVLGFCCA